MKRGLLVAGLVACVVLTGCDSPSEPVVRTPGALAVASGDGQTSAVAAPLGAPLVVRVVDADGRPADGAAVTFTVEAGGGVVAPAHTTADAEGLARAHWTLGTVAGDSQRVSARADGAPSAALAVFRAVARPGAPERLVTVAGDEQQAQAGTRLADSLAVRLTDHWANPVAGQTVTWQVAAGGGSVSPASSVTGVDGVARTAWRTGSAGGTQQVVARFGTVADTLWSRPFVVGILNRLGGNDQFARVGTAVPDSLRVEFRDADGLPAAGVRVAWSTTSGTLSPAVSVTDAEGRAAARWTVGTTPGRVGASAVVEGGSVTLPFTARAAGDPVSIEAAEGQNQEAPIGTPLELLGARAVDALGTPVPGVTITWTAQAEFGAVSPTASVTDATGVARTRWDPGLRYGQGHVWAYLPSGTNVIFQAFSALPTDALVTRVPTSDPNTPTLRVTDNQGRPIPGVQIKWQSERARAVQYSETRADGLSATRWSPGWQYLSVEVGRYSDLLYGRTIDFTEP